jgi:hypothetical protein
MKKLLPLFFALLPMFILAQAPKAAADRPLYDIKSIGDIRITLPSKNWTDALDSLRIYGDGMLVGTATIDGSTYQNVGVRYRGDKSYQTNLKRNPFSIKLNYKEQGQNHQGYTALKVSSALRDPSMVREVLFYEIAGKYMAAPLVSYTKMYINEEYIGLFVNVESVDDNFTRKHFGSAGHPFFKAGVDYKPEVPTTCKQNIAGALEFESNLDCYKANFEAGSPAGWDALQEMTRLLNNDLKNASRMLDVDKMLWMLALNNVMVNLSSYTGTANNYYLYQDNFGRFQPVHWDLNLAFGGLKNIGTGSDLELRDLQRLDPMLHADNALRPLIKQLLSDDLNKKVYLNHIDQIVRENFKNGAYEKRAQELQAMIVLPFNDDKFKTYSMEDFQNSLKTTVGRRSKIPGIVELMTARTKFLTSHPELTALPSTISDVTQQGRAKFDEKKITGYKISAKADRFPKRMWIYYRQNDQQPFFQMQMEEEKSSKVTSGERLFVANIEASAPDIELQYYILVENAGAVSFYPNNYSVKPLRVKLADLNK